LLSFSGHPVHASGSVLSGSTVPIGFRTGDTDIQGPRKQINPQSCLSFCPPSALRQKSHIDNMLPLARLEGEQISGAIYVYLFISATLKSISSIEYYLTVYPEISQFGSAGIVRKNMQQ